MKPQKIKLKINGREVEAVSGQTIMEAAAGAGIGIPSLCYHPDLDVKANCRVCAVEIKGRDRLVTACSTAAQAGMDIQVDSPAAKEARIANLELIFAEHAKKCGNCLRQPDCDLLRLSREYGASLNRFPDRKNKRKTYRFANAVEIDGTQCIDCNNCVEACERQGIGYLEMTGDGIEREIRPVADKKKACIYCGQCTAHCPVASAQEQSAVEEVEKVLCDKDLIVVAQFAPSVRVALGESFGLPYGTNCEGQITTALRRLGFNHVFDVNFGADITTLTEAAELLERVGDRKAVFPMMTSCCPAWVAYVEFYHPELIPNLTTARSPHIHSAGAIKTYWAKQQGIDPKKIRVISIMPCTAKKYEASRRELWLNGRPLVDYVLTTRELAYLIKRKRLNFAKLPAGTSDTPFNSGSGAAAIYGASGGVMESALRSAAVLACEGKKNTICDKRLEFKDVRGLADLKETTVIIGGKKLRVGVVNGLGNFHRLLPKLKNYHYIEVMACPGGCLGGGGQPIPTTDEIRRKRLAGLYEIDKKRGLRRAHENKPMLEVYNWIKKQGLAAKVLHTKFKKSSGSDLTTHKS